MDERLHVIGKLSECDRYIALNPLFGKAFAFLKRTDLADLPSGKYEIDGERCWANLMDVTLKPTECCLLEAHRRYIDIQAPITGQESIGLAKMDEAALSLPFDADRDCVLYDGEFESVILKPGDFAIFYPPLGAHAPCGRVHGETDRIRKAVIKVAIS